MPHAERVAKRGFVFGQSIRRQILTESTWAIEDRALANCAEPMRVMVKGVMMHRLFRPTVVLAIALSIPRQSLPAKEHASVDRVFADAARNCSRT